MTRRVLHVITRLTLGGSSENTVASIVGLERAGYECTLAVGLGESETPVVESARRRGCRIIDVPALGRDAAPLRDLAALGALVRLIRREHPTIVHTHTSKAGFVGRLAAHLARAPALIHQPHGHIFYGYYSRFETTLYVVLERIAAHWTDRIIALTERGIDEHLARGIGRREQYVWVPSGVPTAELRARTPGREAARARLAIDPEAFVVAAVGRFVPIKGFDLLVAALPRILEAVPSARLVLVGDGPERAALEAQAVALRVSDRVHVTGATDDVAGYLATADVFALPSRNEGMGRALVEAMALAIPPVGAAVGGVPSVIVDGECGRLVPPDDVGALANALVELGRNPPLCAKLGEAAVQRAEQFSTAVAEARMLAVYRAVIGEKRLA